MKPLEALLREKIAAKALDYEDEYKDHFESVEEMIKIKLAAASAEMAYKNGAESLLPLVIKMYEALELINKFGYGVNVEKNLKVRNTASVVEEVLAEIDKELK
jgi:hypothetical protein